MPRTLLSVFVLATLTTACVTDDATPQLDQAPATRIALALRLGADDRGCAAAGTDRVDVYLGGEFLIEGAPCAATLSLDLPATAADLDVIAYSTTNPGPGWYGLVTLATGQAFATAHLEPVAVP